MAKSTTLASVTVQAQGDALARLLDNGYLKIYDGLQPATADTAVAAQHLLATLRFDATSAPATTSAGVINFATAAMATGVLAVYTGTAAWYRCQKADGVTNVLDGDIDTTTGNLVLSTVAIQLNATVSITAYAHSVLKSSAGL